MRCTLDVPLAYSCDWCMILHREAGEAKANGPYFSCERIKDPVDSTWHNTWCFRIARHIVCLARPCGMRLQRRGGLRELRGLPLQAFPATALFCQKNGKPGSVCRRVLRGGGLYNNRYDFGTYRLCFKTPGVAPSRSSASHVDADVTALTVSLCRLDQSICDSAGICLVRQRRLCVVGGPGLALDNVQRAQNILQCRARLQFASLCFCGIVFCLELETCLKGARPFVDFIIEGLHKTVIENVKQEITRDLGVCEVEDWDCSTKQPTPSSRRTYLLLFKFTLAPPSLSSRRKRHEVRSKLSSLSRSWCRG